MKKIVPRADKSLAMTRLRARGSSMMAFLNSTSDSGVFGARRPELREVILRSPSSVLKVMKLKGVTAPMISGKLEILSIVVCRAFNPSRVNRSSLSTRRMRCSLLAYAP
jgi:hypothetical protein